MSAAGCRSQPPRDRLVKLLPIPPPSLGYIISGNAHAAADSSLMRPGRFTTRGWIFMDHVEMA